jgi:O-antigen/teichoic acid export membrane protein
LLVVIFGRAAQFILLLWIMKVATTVLSPSEMGRLSLITAATGFFSLFLVNPVGMFINRRLHSWDLQGSVRYYFNLYWIYLAGISIFAALLLLSLDYFHLLSFQFSVAWILVLVCGTLFFNTINQTVIPSLNLLGFRGQFIILTLATIAFGFIASYVFVKFYSPIAEFWLLGLLIGQIIFGIVGASWFFGKTKTPSPSAFPVKSQILSLLNFSWPIAIAVGFNWLQTQGYRFFVADSLGLSSLGLFVAGYGISAGLIAGFESVVTTYFQPRFYRKVNQHCSVDQSIAWDEYAAAILPSLVLFSILLVSLAPALTRLMLGPAYISAAEFVIWGVVAESGRVISGVYAMSAHAKMDTKFLLIPNFLGAFICIALVLVLIPFAGIHGVGLARAISAGAMVMAMHFIMVKSFSMSLPYRLILKSILLGCLISIIIGLINMVIGGENSLVTSLLLIGAAGAMFLPIFYKLILPFLPRNYQDQ